MNIFVFRTPSGVHSAGIDELACSVRGRIVETWPVNTAEEARFLVTHGTAFAGATTKVVQLAELALGLLTEHPELTKKRDIKAVAASLGFWKRAKLAFYIIFKIQRIDE